MALENPRSVYPYHKFLERSVIEHQLFGWVKAQLYLFEGADTQNSIRGFLRFHNISEKEWPFQSALTTYNRMNKEFIDMCQTPELKTEETK